MSRSLLLASIMLLGPISGVVAQDLDALQRELDEQALNSAVTDDCHTLRTSRTMHALGDTVVVWYGRFDPAQYDEGKALEAAVAAKRCLVNAGIATELRNENKTVPVSLDGVTVAHIVILSIGPTAAGVVYRLPRDFSLIEVNRTFHIYDARVGRWAATHFAYLIGRADKLLEAVKWP